MKEKEHRFQNEKEDLQKVRQTVFEIMEALDRGLLRVAEKSQEGQWTVNSWVKEAILIYFRLMPMVDWECPPFTFRDKIPLKKNFAELKVRAVPPACVRYGSFLEEGVVLMPSYVNIGAYVGKDTMVDTWATVGSCAQIGRGVHLSGGVGIGGVLEPPSAAPVIIEDGAFIGSRSILVEGVIVEEEAVLGANVTLTASTPIVDTREGRFTISKGRIPKRAVVVPGTLEKEIQGGKIHGACAYIIGDRKPSTDLKTSLNLTLREFDLPGL